MFKQILPELLGGEFICPVSHQDGFSFLSDTDNYAQIDAYLEQMGLKLSTTRHGGAFFCAYIDTEADEKKAAKETFRQIKHTLRPVVSFLELLMRALERDDMLEVGAVIEVNKLMSVIDANPSFRNELQSLLNQIKGKSSDGTDHQRLNKVLSYFKDHGYLTLANAEREIYRMTGKVEYILEAIEFLMEHESVTDIDEEPELNQAGNLL